MSFLSTLGKIASIAGPLVAAPFTGGASLLGMMGASAGTASAIGAGLGAAGKVAGGISSGRAKGRVDEAELGMRSDALRNQDLLDQARLRLQSNRQRSGQLVGSDLLGSMHAPTDPRAAKFMTAGGISPETLQRIRGNAQTALDTGSDVPQLQTTPTPQAGKTDSFLNALSYGGTALGALKESGAFQPKPSLPEPAAGSLGAWSSTQQPAAEPSLLDAFLARQKQAEADALPNNKFGQVNLPWKKEYL